MLQDLSRENLNLNQCEEKILDARLSDKSIIQFPTDDLAEVFDRILFMIVTVTGYDIPQNDTQLGMLRTDITNFILEFGYKLLNEDEIILAFKLNGAGICAFADGTGIPEVIATNNRVSTMFCGKVLSNYMILRTALDAKLKNLIDGYPAS